MKVLVLWADHRSTNLGIQALARGAEELVRDVWPHASVDVENHTPGPWPRFVPPLSFVRAWAGGAGEEQRRLAEYDLVLDTASGDSFADIYGLRRLFQMSSTRSSAARAGCAVVMAPQTVGPFTTRVGAAVARASLRGVTQVMARDPESAAYCRTVLKREPLLATDLVFAIPRPAVEPHRDVIVNVSGLLWAPNPHVDATRYRDAVLGYCSGLRAAGKSFALLAHVVGDGRGDTDVYAVREAAQALGGEVECLVPADVEDVRRMIASARLTIGARMHACLNSLSIGVPSIPWAYSRKFEPLAKDLGWPHVLDLRGDQDVGEAALGLSHRLLQERPAELDAVRRTASLRLESAKDALRSIHA